MQLGMSNILCPKIHYGPFTFHIFIPSYHMTYFSGVILHTALIFLKLKKKRIIRIIMNARKRDSRCQLFKNLKILPLKSQYIFFLFYYLLPKIEIYMN